MARIHYLLILCCVVTLLVALLPEREGKTDVLLAIEGAAMSIDGVIASSSSLLATLDEYEKLLGVQPGPTTPLRDRMEAILYTFHIRSIGSDVDYPYCTKATGFILDTPTTTSHLIACKRGPTLTSYLQYRE